jgi:hypothetical protein
MINPLTSPEFLIKLLMICVLIFSTYSYVFKYYINGLIKKTFKDDLNKIIDVGMKNNMTNIISNPIIKLFLNYIPKDIEKAYINESEDTIFFNNYLLFNLLCINIIIITILFVFIYIYKVTCNTNINLLESAITNILALIVIGYFEYKFFIIITNKYTPMLPSKIADTFINRIKSDLEIDNK